MLEAEKGARGGWNLGLFLYVRDRVSTECHAVSAAESSARQWLILRGTSPGMILVHGFPTTISSIRVQILASVDCRRAFLLTKKKGTDPKWAAIRVRTAKPPQLQTPSHPTNLKWQGKLRLSQIVPIWKCSAISVMSLTNTMTAANESLKPLAT